MFRNPNNDIAATHPHACTQIANRHCTLGATCPFFALPNDVCVPYAEGWCTFGERCTRRHLGGAKLAELRALPSSKAAVEQHAQQQAARNARNARKMAAAQAAKQCVPRSEPVPPATPHPSVSALSTLASMMAGTAATAPQQQQQTTSLLVSALAHVVASAALGTTDLAAAAKYSSSSNPATPSQSNKKAAPACPCAAQRGECAAGARCWFRSERDDLCVAYVRGACTFGASCKRYHDGELALAFAELMKIEANAKVDETWLRENTRVCPSCRVPVVRTQGCDHMQCRCGYAFDWSALADVHGAGSAALFKQRVTQARKARLAKRDERFQIFVCAQSGATITLELPLRAQTPLSALVALIVARTALDGDALRLLYGGKQLSLQHTPKATLADFNVQNGATLHLVMRLPGGV